MAKLTENQILQRRTAKLDQAFIDMFDLYREELYRFCYISVWYHPTTAVQIVRFIFGKAYQYFHKFTPHDKLGYVSFRAYLYALAVPMVMHHRQRSQRQAWPRALRKHWLEPDLAFWHQFQQADAFQVLVAQLWYGAHLSLAEIAQVVQRDDSAIQAWLDYISKDTAALLRCYKNIEQSVTMPSTQRLRLLRQVTATQQRAPSFVHPAWWHTMLGPIPTGFALGLVAFGVGLLWYVYGPVTTTPLAQQSAQPVAVVLKQRPHDITPNTTLPTIARSRQSLVVIDTVLYGTDYVVQRSIDTAAETELRPTMRFDINSADYRAVPDAFAYAVPEALTEDQLQFAALKHFSSLPLNQFSYVNGTYYVTETPNEFRPLFIAFNNTGAVEFQMRQAAICALPNLTLAVDHTAAQHTVFDFLISHQFISVDETDLKIVRLSKDDRTISKGKLCTSDATTQVQDREFVFYPPHTVLRYGDGANEFLPMRLRGIAVQLHGNDVTNVRIDPLHSLQQQIVKTNTVTLRPLHEAITLAQSFYYPDTKNNSETQRYAKVFAQWDHLHGNDRLNSLTLYDVQLEYVYDTLNHSIEPYYVFSGEGIDGTGPDDDIRLYVVAATNDIELRGPYRE
ncbi:MAG: hypothetical protein HYV33_04990 [Candidatus Kerfeldbacteria bacterium]|nr:hypothetical protein [Candidatus Kerfeldbacteria bacterium]